MRALAFRIGTAQPNGYPLDCWVGEEADVLACLTSNSRVPDGRDVIPLDLAPAYSTPATVGLDAREARDDLLAADGTDDRLVHTGSLLFAVLDRPGVSGIWRTERDQALARISAPPVVTLRTYLDILDPALAALPWELMRDGAQMLARQEWATMARWAKMQPRPTGKIPWPMRLLVIVGCDPTDVDIEWRDELHDILASVAPRRHWIDHEIFEARVPHTDGVKQELQALIGAMKPDIVHFIGHGRANAGANPAALELVDATNNTSVEWTAQDIVSWFTPNPPRIAVLNACRTSTPEPPGAAIAALEAVGTAFRNAGTSAVVGMQHDVPGIAAARFATAFYAALAAGCPVDAAVVAGRARILNELSDHKSAWALPSVTLGTTPDTVLPMEEDVATARWSTVTAHNDFEAIKSFIDRRRERRVLREGRRTAPSPVAGSPPKKDLMFIVGDNQLGKTWLVKCCLEWFLLYDYKAIYVDFGHGDPLDAIGVLRRIRGDKTAGGNLRPNLYDQFGEFNAALNALLRKKVPAANATADDKDLRYISGKAHPDTMEIAFELFREALKQVAEKRPLIIALDHIGKSGHGIVADDFQEHILPKLITPIRDGDVTNVKALLAVSKDDIAKFGLGGLHATSVECTLKFFDRWSWQLLAREFAIIEQLDRRVADKLILQQDDNFGPNGTWRPKFLEWLREAHDNAFRPAPG